MADTTWNEISRCSGNPCIIVFSRFTGCRLRGMVAYVAKKSTSIGRVAASSSTRFRKAWPRISVSPGGVLGHTSLSAFRNCSLASRVVWSDREVAREVETMPFSRAAMSDRDIASGDEQFLNWFGWPTMEVL